MNYISHPSSCLFSDASPPHLSQSPVFTPVPTLPNQPVTRIRKDLSLTRGIKF